MTTDGSGSVQEDGAEALKLMEDALELLDRCSLPADIGAHLDLAINRLRPLVRPRVLTQEMARRPPARP
jgi:hypothetical protein